MPKRCSWARTDLSIAYHDREWGVPAHNDRLLFEFLILEGAQAGLSWETILRKRENYRASFDNFEPARVARYSQRKVEQLLTTKGSFAIVSKSLPQFKTPRRSLKYKRNSA